MQTLRKRTSPCKYKNDPSRFLGEGITFKAKLIGILEVSEARGDKMCQDALNDLKTAIRAAGEHKQRITISISIDGLRLRDEKTGDCLYHHPVHKISFIAQDMSDSRAFGYIFGSPDTGHRFFGIKTDKTASQVVISMRDLFQVVFELKKKEIEMAKHHSEQHQLKYGSSGYMDSIQFGKDDSDADKGKTKYSQLLKSRGLTSKPGDASTSDYKGPTSEAIADLLDLEHELNSIQQGITQMEKITPSDPFGPLSKSDPYIDPFDDSFSPNPDNLPEELPKPSHHSTTDPPDLFPSNKPPFFPHFSPPITKPSTDDANWFDQETDSLFNDTVSVNSADRTSSPVALNTPAPDADQSDSKKSPVKTDLFTELDPLGTGRVKPYVDKKDFFQDLKNPPKKVLKELITETTATEPPAFYFPATFKDDKTPSTAKSDSAHSSSTIDSASVFTPTLKYDTYKNDPFQDNDPFDKTDPFRQDTFSASLFPHNAPDPDTLFQDKPPFAFHTPSPVPSPSTTPAPASAPAPAPTSTSTPHTKTNNFPLLPSTALRVSLPPPKPQPPTTFKNPPPKSPPLSPETSKTIRRKNYQSLDRSSLRSIDDSPVHEQPFVSTRLPPHTHSDPRSPSKDTYYFLHSPPTSPKHPHPSTPDPPPRTKTSLFLIKPPPLPPKKTNSSTSKPPARPPSHDDTHYDTPLNKKTPLNNQHLKCVQLKNHLGSSSPPPHSTKHSSHSTFPILPPPPHRKPSNKPLQPPQPPGSILNLTLNQLDNTGLENLALTLGIPSDSIYSMTLQELTKVLADKYLIPDHPPTDHAPTVHPPPDKPPDQPPNDTFQPDFEANFSNPSTTAPPQPPSFDKYAVFKELMEEDTKEGAGCGVAEGEALVEGKGEEEDKYAALRQLSMSAEKGEGGSEEEEGGKMDEGGGEVGVGDAGREVEVEVERERERERGGEREGLFPALEEFCGEGRVSRKGEWATFGEAGGEEGCAENENSPLSSDGKEEGRGGGFDWEGGGRVKEGGWKDEEESWDDYSAKESFCSDESSHEERSPEGGGGERYEKGGWMRGGEGGRKWGMGGKGRERREGGGGGGGGKGGGVGGGGRRREWVGRDKWNEETEDEFEESWRKQKERSSSYDLERNGSFWEDRYEGHGKHRDWRSGRSEPWGEKDRHHRYINMRKRSESDNEYRKRCDSDASDKDCVWTFHKNYADPRTTKQKLYYPSSARDRTEHFHDPRSKYRKPPPQKRTPSASEPNRPYDPYPPTPLQHPPYSPSPSPTPTPTTNHYFTYHYPPHNDPAPRHRPSAHHSKPSPRTSRPSSSPNKRSDPSAPSASNLRHFDYFEPFRENPYNHRNFRFDSDNDAFDKPPDSAPDDKPNRWASANGRTHPDGFYSARNPDRTPDPFPPFPDDPKPSPKKSRDPPDPKGRTPLAALHRQDSATTLRKSDSINIFSRDNDPFEGDDFFSSVS